MRPTLRLAVAAALTITFGCAQVDSAQPTSEAAHNPDLTYRPEMIPLAGAEMQNVIAGCRKERLSGELKSFAELANCSNAMIVLAYGWLNFPYMDLVQLIAGSRLAASERVDKGSLTEAEAQTLMAELGKAVNAEVLRRQSSTLGAPLRLASASSRSTLRASATPGSALGSEERPIRQGVADLAGERMLEHPIEPDQVLDLLEDRVRAHPH